MRHLVAVVREDEQQVLLMESESPMMIDQSECGHLAVLVGAQTIDLYLGSTCFTEENSSRYVRLEQSKE